MPEFYVEAPLTAKVWGLVKANSPEQAIERFIQTPFKIGEMTLDDEAEYTESIEIEDVELHEQVSQGNVVYGAIGEAWAEVEEDD